MNEQTIQEIVEEVISRLKVADTDQTVPIAVSARHCHLSSTDLEALFGTDYELTKKADLSQPGQFAAKETVSIVGPRGGIEHVRILGPARSMTQVEVSWTDAIKLGLKPPVRQSGDLIGSSPVTIVGPKGSIYIKEGLIIAEAHIHMNVNVAKRLQVENGEYVSVKVESKRPISFEKVLIRVSPRYRLEMHIDTDEANAGAIISSAFGTIRKHADNNREERLLPKVSFVQNEESLRNYTDSIFEGKLLTQREVTSMKQEVITIRKSTIVTPLAYDTARDSGKSIHVID